MVTINPIDIDSIEKQEYLNKELNQLVKEKNAQSDRRDTVFNERKQILKEN